MIAPARPAIAALLASAAFTTQAQQWDTTPSHWEMVVSPNTFHWNRSPEHRQSVLVALERFNRDSPTLWGLAVFRNSFGQPSTYAYYGMEWNHLLGHPKLYAKLTGGLIYGYVGEYKNKVPLNYKGFSPGLVPGLGYRFGPNDTAQVALLGTAGFLVSYSRRF